MSSEVMSSRLPRNSAGDTWDVTQAASAAVATRPANDIDLIFRIRPPGKERSFHIRSYKRYPGRASPFAVPQPPSGGRPTTLVQSTASSEPKGPARLLSPRPAREGQDRRFSRSTTTSSRLPLLPWNRRRLDARAPSQVATPTDCAATPTPS